MFKRIKKLDEKITNKIAAGEVIERPASVVKELVENSIDADAKAITIEIKNAGKTYIRITDDGIGIYRDDIELAFERHATSKISSDRDIYNLNSLGFRGEALASIASVSNVEIITKTKDDEFGIRAEFRNGKIVYKNEVGCPVGTTIIIKDLFYNTPVRYKFLKSDATETNHISMLVNKLALSHPEISFRYIINNKNIFTTPGNNDVYSAILSIYDKEIAKNLIEIYNKKDDVKLRGYISNINYSRGNRQMQSIFVNGRYIKSKIITKAIDEAYKTLLPLNKYPACFLYLDINPNMIDVNIHPAKTEIRFHNEEFIKNFISNTIKEKLLNTNLIPTIKMEKKSAKMDNNISELDKNITVKNKNIDIEKVIDNISKQLVIDTTNKDFSLKKNEYIVKENKHLSKSKEYPLSNIDTYIKKAVNIRKKEKNTVLKESNLKYDGTFFNDLVIIGQLFSTYIICEKDEKMYIIDQHAAHERILYEKYLNSYFKSDIISQILLEPIIIELNYLDKEVIFQNMNIFENLGYKIDDFGYNTVILREVPVLFGTPVAKSFFLEILEKLTNNIKNNYELKEEKIIQTACKNAIKANDSLKFIEIDKLIKELQETKNPFTCPHGRPIIISVSKSEIERKFLRT
ncbi:DNA mismatch repair endonuclease MutL [Caminicella sporogenes]|uniref:DNA mismatch repair endonuclease MutL n=1 Tax=Caminicella sporogenes TaxID=166485 RepID=UPI002540001D|nr:DNA mismatch repair endonuclease MutL [Caminicella sporogenes]WIF94705.1 DNA mismatch repair endonuclease MutL [Caminicella sporogenes]